MRSVSRSLGLMLAAVAGLAMSLVLMAPASANAQDEAPSAEATWELADGVQLLCVPPGVNHYSYFVGFISGHWDTELTAEVQGFPEGTDVDMAETYPPGDNGDKSIGTVWIMVKLPPLDYGEYPATLFVSDGTVTQTMGMLIKVQDGRDCD